MKKIITCLTILFILSSSVFAQVTVGIKGIGNLGVGTTLPKEIKDELNAEVEAAKRAGSTFSWNRAPVVTGGLEIMGRYNFPDIPSLGVQANLTLLLNNGGTLKRKLNNKSESITATYNTLELPVFAVYSIEQGPITFAFDAGIDLTLALGKMKETETIELLSQTTTYDSEIVSKLIFGVLFGVEAKFDIESTVIGIAIQFESDLSPMKIKHNGSSEIIEAFTRRGVRYSIGCEYKL